MTTDLGWSGAPDGGASAARLALDFDEFRDLTVIGAKYSTNTGVPGVVAGQP